MIHQFSFVCTQVNWKQRLEQLFVHPCYHSRIHNSKEAETTRVSKNGQIKCVCARSVRSSSLPRHGRSLPAPLSVGFPRQEQRSWLLFLSPGNFNPGVESTSPALASTISTTEPPGSQQNASFHTEWSTDRCHKTDGLGKHYVKWKKPVTKEHILYGTIYMGCLQQINLQRN